MNQITEIESHGPYTPVDFRDSKLAITASGIHVDIVGYEIEMPECIKVNGKVMPGAFRGIVFYNGPPLYSYEDCQLLINGTPKEQLKNVIGYHFSEEEIKEYPDAKHAFEFAYTIPI